MKRFYPIALMFAIILIQLNCSQSPGENSPFNSDLTPGFEKRIKKIGEISDVFKAPNIIVDQSQVYIWDKFLCKLRVYSKENMKKVADIGKRGQGPKEFSGINDASIDDDYIYINSHPKLSVFSKDGTFVRELRTTTMTGSFKPIGSNFIGKRYIYTPKESPKHKFGYVLHDAKLNKIKDLLEAEYRKSHMPITQTKTKVLLFRDCCKGIVYKDKFYFGSTGRGFYFAVFDSEGNKLYEIDKDYKKQPVTTEIKDKMLSPIRNSEYWPEYSKKYEPSFPEYFPAYINFALANDSLYVFKFPKTGSKTIEVEVLDLEGNLKKTLQIPSFLWKGLMENNFYFYEGNVYFVELGTENEENLEFFECRLDT